MTCVIECRDTETYNAVKKSPVSVPDRRTYHVKI